MMAPHLTKTRRAFLMSVNAGDVVDGPDEHGNIHVWLIDPPYLPRRVNLRAAEALKAGWVEHLGATWDLTDVGATALGASR